MSKFTRVLPLLALLAGFAPLAAQAQQTTLAGCNQTQHSQSQNNTAGEAEAGGY